MDTSGDESNVFVSWSKPRSRLMATAICTWLNDVIQRAYPWMSEQIPAGAEWRRLVSDRLKPDQFGIVCVTPENQQEPWLNFEAGALSKTLTAVRVCPVLIAGMEKNDLREPLGMFQAKRSDNESEMFELVTSVNDFLPGPKLTKEKLNSAFQKNWSDLSAELSRIQAPKPTPKRTDSDKIDEILGLTRAISRDAALSLSRRMVPKRPKSEPIRILEGGGRWDWHDFANDPDTKVLETFKWLLGNTAAAGTLRKAAAASAADSESANDKQPPEDKEPPEDEGEG